MKPVEQRLSGGLCVVAYMDIVLLIQMLTGIDLFSGYIAVIIMFAGTILALAFSIFMSRDYEYEKENNNIIFGVGLAFAVIILLILVSTMQYFTV